MIFDYFIFSTSHIMAAGINMQQNISLFLLQGCIILCIHFYQIPNKSCWIYKMRWQRSISYFLVSFDFIYNLNDGICLWLFTIYPSKAISSLRKAVLTIKCNTIYQCVKFLESFKQDPPKWNEYNTIIHALINNMIH